MSSLQAEFQHLLMDYDWESNNMQLNGAFLDIFIAEVNWANEPFIINFCLGQDVIHKKHRRHWTCIKDYMDTPWGQLLGHPDVCNPTSYVGMQFRRRFRVPFPLFEYLVDICRDYNVFEMKNTQKERIPIQIKLLVCLRILGRGNVCDDASEMGSVGTSTCNHIFKLFVNNF